MGDLLSQTNRFDEAEAAYRKAIELNPKWAGPWVSLGNLLQDRMKRYEEAEVAYRSAIELDEVSPFHVANLARLLARLARNDEASQLFRQSIKLAKGDDSNLLLQAHSWLGNSDLAMQALDALAERASKGSGTAFQALIAQCFECHAIGISVALVELIERSRFADFLQPFALALRAARGEPEALLGVAVEVRGIAEEVLRSIRGGDD